MIAVRVFVCVHPGASVGSESVNLGVLRYVTGAVASSEFHRGIATDV